MSYTIQPVLAMESTIPLPLLMGEQGSSGFLSDIANSVSSGVSVIFGENDPMLNSYRNFKEKVFNTFDAAKDMIQRATGIATGTIDIMVPITTEEQFGKIPECMYEPILTYAPVRELLEKDKIHGFGIKPESLPYMEEDMWGRLAQDNGKVDFIPGEETPEFFDWTFHDTDPAYKIEDLEAIDESRQYIDHWLENELKQDIPRDFTNKLAPMGSHNQ